jgi:hypothetical protein
MDSAKAIAATGSGARGLSRDASDDSSLVKIMEDGTTQSLINFGSASGSWKPNVSFISVGDDGSAYICFESVYYEYNNNTTTNIQFVRVYKDNHYDVLWPLDPKNYTNTDGTVATWTWWGMDSDPLAKGPDGKLYFKVSNQSAATDDRIYRYDPTTAAPPERITPSGASLSISNFMVDSKSHLFIQSGGNNSSSASSFLRYYTPGVTAPTNIYYSSSSTSMWVRGYIPSADGSYAIINGNNIRGMNGILKVSGLVTGNLSYDLAYPNTNSNNNAGYINLTKYYSQTDEYETNLIKQTTNSWPMAYEWLSSVKSGTTYDKDKLLARIARYFVQDSTTLDFKSGAVAYKFDGTTALSATDLLATKLTDPDTTNNDDSIKFTHTTWDGSTSSTATQSVTCLGEYISNYPEDFLRNTFNKKLFKDWLEEPAQATLKDINFDYVGAMTWGSNGLYALYSSSWWGGSTGSTDGKVLKLLDALGAPDLKVLSLGAAKTSPSKIKILGDYIYYRYDVLDSSGNATGFHQLARKNLITGTDQELTKNLPGLPSGLEMLAYDVSDDNTILYFVAYNQTENKVTGGKVTIDSNTWSALDTAKKLTNLRIIK